MPRNSNPFDEFDPPASADANPFDAFDPPDAAQGQPARPDTPEARAAEIAEYEAQGGGVLSALERGSRRIVQTGAALLPDSWGAEEFVRGQQEEIAALPQHPAIIRATEAANRADGIIGATGAFLGELHESPDTTGALIDQAAELLPQLPAFALGTKGADKIIPVALTGAKRLAATLGAGGFLGSVTSTYGPNVAEALQKGIEWDQAEGRAALQSAVQGGIDGLTAAVIPWRIGPNQWTNIPAQTFIQMVGGATGEVARQAAVGEDAPLGDVVAEGLLEALGLPGEAATAYFEGRAQSRRAVDPETGVPAGALESELDPVEGEGGPPPGGGGTFYPPVLAEPVIEVAPGGFATTPQQRQTLQAEAAAAGQTAERAEAEALYDRIKGSLPDPVVEPAAEGKKRGPKAEMAAKVKAEAARRKAWVDRQVRLMRRGRAEQSQEAARPLTDVDRANLAGREPELQALQTLFSPQGQAAITPEHRATLLERGYARELASGLLMPLPAARRELAALSSRLRPAAEADVSVSGEPTYYDPRQARPEYRERLLGLLREIKDSTPEAPAPAWVTETLRAVPGMATHHLQAAIARGADGHPLGVGEQRAMLMALDVITGQRTNPDRLFQAERERELSKILRTRPEAGQMFDETEYPAEFSFKQRALQELFAEAAQVDEGAAIDVMEAALPEEETFNELAYITAHGRARAKFFQGPERAGEAADAGEQADRRVVEEPQEEGDAAEGAEAVRSPAIAAAETAVEELQALNPQLKNKLRVEVLSEEEMAERPTNSLTGKGASAGRAGAVIELKEDSTFDAVLEEIRHMIDMLLGGSQLSKWINEDKSVEKRVREFLNERRAEGDLAPNTRYDDGAEMAQSLLDQYFRNPDLVEEALPDIFEYLEKMGAAKYRPVIEKLIEQRDSAAGEDEVTELDDEPGVTAAEEGELSDDAQEALDLMEGATYAWIRSDNGTVTYTDSKPTAEYDEDPGPSPYHFNTKKLKEQKFSKQAFEELKAAGKLFYFSERGGGIIWTLKKQEAVEPIEGETEEEAAIRREINATVTKHGDHPIREIFRDKLSDGYDSRTTQPGIELSGDEFHELARYSDPVPITYRTKNGEPSPLDPKLKVVKIGDEHYVTAGGVGSGTFDNGFMSMTPLNTVVPRSEWDGPVATGVDRLFLYGGADHPGFMFVDSEGKEWVLTGESAEAYPVVSNPRGKITKFLDETKKEERALLEKVASTKEYKAWLAGLPEILTPTKKVKEDTPEGWESKQSAKNVYSRWKRMVEAKALLQWNWEKFRADPVEFMLQHESVSRHAEVDLETFSFKAEHGFGNVLGHIEGQLAMLKKLAAAKGMDVESELAKLPAVETTEQQEETEEPEVDDEDLDYPKAVFSDDVANLDFKKRVPKPINPRAADLPENATAPQVAQWFSGGVDSWLYNNSVLFKDLTKTIEDEKSIIKSIAQSDKERERAIKALEERFPARRRKDILHAARLFDELTRGFGLPVTQRFAAIIAKGGRKPLIEAINTALDPKARQSLEAEELASHIAAAKKYAKFAPERYLDGENRDPSDRKAGIRAFNSFHLDGRTRIDTPGDDKTLSFVTEIEVLGVPALVTVDREAEVFTEDPNSTDTETGSEIQVASRGNAYLSAVLGPNALADMTDKQIVDQVAQALNGKGPWFKYTRDGQEQEGETDDGEEPEGGDEGGGPAVETPPVVPTPAATNDPTITVPVTGDNAVDLAAIRKRVGWMYTMLEDWAGMDATRRAGPAGPGQRPSDFKIKQAQNAIFADINKFAEKFGPRSVATVVAKLNNILTDVKSMAERTIAMDARTENGDQRTILDIGLKAIGSDIKGNEDRLNAIWAIVKPLQAYAKEVEGNLKVQKAAQEPATSPENDLPPPTEAQQEAGNYQKGHLTLHGLDISIENPAGTKRRPEWPALKHHYGYFKGTVGKDKDHIDVFLGEGAADATLPVIVIDQINPDDGAFDEHKVMLGFKTMTAAKAGYLSNYESGWKGLGAAKQFTLDEFKAWLEKGDTKAPVALKPKKLPKVPEGEKPAKPEHDYQDIGGRLPFKRAGEAVKTMKKDTDEATIEAILDELSLSGLFPEPVKDATTGVGVYFDKIRERMRTGTEYVFDQMPQIYHGRRHKPGTWRGTREGNRQALLRWATENDAFRQERIEQIRAAAERYIAAVGEVVSVIAPAKTVEEARQAVANKFLTQDSGFKMRGYTEFYERHINLVEREKLNPLYGTRPLSSEFERLINTSVEEDAQRSALKDPIRMKNKVYRREGVTDWRKGKDATEKDLVEEFGFRAINFGNWVTQDERRVMVNHAYDALADMAEILGIPRKATSLGGILGLALGSHGKGGVFSAHYDPNSPLISITKTRGDGALAHEWFHALDDNIGTSWGKMQSDVKRWGNSRRDGFIRALHQEFDEQNILAQLRRYLKDGGITIGGKPVGGKYGSEANRRESAKLFITSRLWNQNNFRSFTDTHYARNVAKMSDYWKRGSEMFARAGEAFILDKMIEADKVNNWLVNELAGDGFATPENGYKGTAYPAGLERSLFANEYEHLLKNINWDEAGKPSLKVGYASLLSQRSTDLAARMDALLPQIDALMRQVELGIDDLPREGQTVEKFVDGNGNPNVPAIARRLGKEFAEGKRFQSIVVARNHIGTMIGKKIEPGSDLAKVADEALELGVVFAARAIVRGGGEPGAIYDRLVKLYNDQPRLGVRTSGSIERQAYSTPVPLAYIASLLAGVSQETSVYEPTAGNGMLLIGAADRQVYANELDPVRAGHLRALGYDATAQDATEIIPPEKVSVVIANPPFGTVKEDGKVVEFPLGPIHTTQVDHAIAMKALQAMRDDGAAVLIVGAPGDGNYQNKHKLAFYGQLYDGYNVVDHFTVSGDLYARQGASWPVDVIVIRGKGKSDMKRPVVQAPRQINTFDELRKEIDHAQQLAKPAAHDRVGSEVGGTSIPGGDLGPAGGEAQQPGGGTGTSTGTPPSSNRGGSGTGRAPGTPGGGGGQGGAAGQPAGGQPGGSGTTPVGTPTGEGGDAGAGGRTAAGGEQQRPGGGSPAAGGQSGGVDAAAAGGGLVKLPDFKDNKLVTKTDAEAAIARLRAKMGGSGTVRSGIDPTILADIVEVGVYYAEGGIRRFYSWARQVVGTLGTEVTPYLAEAYAKVRDRVGAKGMDTDKAVKEFVAKIAKEGFGPRKNELGEVVYQPRSAASSVDTRIPANLVQPLEDAFNEIEQRVGNIDDYVAKQLEYTQDELFGHFSGEQVDAIALALWNFQKGSAFIIGDQTGIGKGRVVAGVLRGAMKAGHVPVFVTEKPGLYKDILRDFNDIMTGDMDETIAELNPVMTNNNETVTDDFGKVLMKTPAKHNADFVIPSLERGNIGKHKILFTTYSQMQTVKGQKTPRMELLLKIAPNAVFVFDESHNAGGQGEKPRRKKKGGGEDYPRARLAREIAEMGHSVMFSSATYAKNPQVMDLYHRTDMRYAVPDPKELANAISSGGIPLQQVVSTMLAKSAQYLRRERSFAGIRYETEVAKVDRQAVDSAAVAFKAIKQFSDAWLDSQEFENLQESWMSSQSGGKTNSGDAKVDGIGFAEIQHNLSSQFMLALKANEAVEKAVAAAMAGEKPVFTLANTMETFIVDMMEQGGLKVGSQINMTFQDVFERYLKKTATVTFKNYNGEVVKREFFGDRLTPGSELARLYREAQNAVRGVKVGKDVPISPIDYIKHEFAKRTEALGKRHIIGEITGRGLTVDYSTEIPTIQSRAKETSTKAKIETLSKFNHGDTTGLLLNQSGSTGLSAHAAPDEKGKRPRDKRPRVMFIVQPDLNIDTHMQLLGRINRTGQVVLPRYVQLVGDVPAEVRPAAILLKKMASLNANTTAARKSAVMVDTVPDLLNWMGAEAALRVLRDDPQLLADLSMTIPEKEDAEADEGLIKKLTGRMLWMDSTRQQQVFDVLEAEYQSIVETELAQGRNPFEAPVLNLDAKVIEEHEMVPDDAMNQSVFARGATAYKVDVQRAGKPPTKAAVLKMIEEELDGEALQYAATKLNLTDKKVSDPEIAQRAGFKQVESIVEKLEAEFRGYADEVIRGDPDTAPSKYASLRATKDATVGLMRALPIGQPVAIQDEDSGPSKARFGVIVGYHHHGKAANPAAPSGWRIVIAMNDSDLPLRLPLSQVTMNQDGTQPFKVYRSEYARVGWVSGMPDKVWDRFDKAQATTRETRVLITGNIFAAFAKLPRGQIVNFTWEGGRQDQGILLPALVEWEDVKGAADIVLKDPYQIKQVLDQTDAILKASDGELSLQRIKDGLYRLRTDKSKSIGEKFFGDKSLTQAAGAEFISSGDSMYLTFRADRYTLVMEALLRNGRTLAASSYKDEIRKLLGLGGAKKRGRYSQAPSAPSTDKRIAEGAEYESRLFGGAYGPSRVNMAPGTAKRKMIEQARVRYNALRAEFGLPLVKDWSKRPERMFDAMRRGEHSRGDLTGGTTIAKATEAVRTAFGRSTEAILAAGNIRIVGTVADLPGGPHPANTRAWASPDGPVYIVAETTPATLARGIVLHEVGTHVGMEQMLGKALWESVQQQVRDRLAAKDPVFTAARLEVPEDTAAELEIEETIGYLVQRNPTLPLVRRILAAIRQWLFRVTGGRFIQLTDDDLVMMATAALRKVAEPEVSWDAYGRMKIAGMYAAAYHGTGKLFSRFDLSYVGSGYGAIAHGWGINFVGSDAVAKSYTPKGQAADKMGVYPESDEFFEIEAPDGTNSVVYRVDIPDDARARMLQMNDSIDEQPSFVMGALMNDPISKQVIESQRKRLAKDRGALLGRTFYSLLANKVDGAKQASLHLKSLGIPGAISRDQWKTRATFGEEDEDGVPVSDDYDDGFTVSEVDVIWDQELLDSISAQMSPQRYSRATSPTHSTATEEKDKALKDLAAGGQPIDSIFRAMFSPFGGIDAHGRWKPGLRMSDKAHKIIRDAKFADDGPFAWMNPTLHKARAGLLEQIDTPEEYAPLEKARQRREARLLRRALDIVDTITKAGVEDAEARVLQAILTGEVIPDSQWAAISEPIREAIVVLGQEAVEAGIVSKESFERNKGIYLHRVYQKHEAERMEGSSLARWVDKISGARRRRLTGEAMKGRGMFVTVSTKALNEGNEEELTPKIGAKFRLLEARAEAKVESGKRKVLDRVWWPADQEIPKTAKGYEDAGVFEVRGTKGGKWVLWRDWTKDERANWGEILDARYTIARTFLAVSRDLATAEFFKDIYTQGIERDWVRNEEPSPMDGGVIEGQDATRGLYTDTDWVRVPSTEIPNTGGRKRWGVLAGRYIRASIYRDLSELNLMNRRGLWQDLLTQWKLNKTARSPVVHMNNVMSNLVLMDLADVRWRDLRQAIESFRNSDEIFREAEDLGVFGATELEQQLRRNVLEPVWERIQKQKFGKDGELIETAQGLSAMADGLIEGLKKADRKMIDLYTMEDQLFRLATYIRRRSLGDTQEEAANIAIDQFINYDIRAPWINTLRETALPFIGYTYRAVPLIAQAAMTRPWKIAKYAFLAYMANAMAYALAGDDDEDEERRALPDEKQGYTWLGVPRMIRLPWSDSRGNPVFIDIRRWVPAGDIYDLNQGSGAIPVPAPIQFGGPLMLGAELALNKQAFSGKEIVNELVDTPVERTGKVASWAWRSWMPSGAYIPKSWYWDKVGEAMSGQTSALGEPASLPAALASSVGIKARGLDIDVALRSKALEYERVERAIRFEMSKVKRDIARGAMDRDGGMRELRHLNEKMKRLNEKRRENLRRGPDQPVAEPQAAAIVLRDQDEIVALKADTVRALESQGLTETAALFADLPDTPREEFLRALRAELEGNA